MGKAAVISGFIPSLTDLMDEGGCLFAEIEEQSVEEIRKASGHRTLMSFHAEPEATLSLIYNILSFEERRFVEETLPSSLSPRAPPALS